MPKKISTKDLQKYVENNIDSFHSSRLESLKKLKFSKILTRKNPYLFKAKHIRNANELVKTFMDAHLSSQEETMFGDFLEKLAVYVSNRTYGGRKSAAKGIDLEFQKGNFYYIVSIKSGPNWGNSSQIQKMRADFVSAKRTLKSNFSKRNLVSINGCCYGKDNNPDKGEYMKYCGQRFWKFISGDADMYIDIIEPLGYKAREKNETFLKEYDRILNRFTKEFMEDYSKNGEIDWKELIRINSGK